MHCLICRQKIKPGEQIFFGNQVQYIDEDGWSYSGDQETLIGALHLSCIESPPAAPKTLSTMVPGYGEEGSKTMVSRSDALSMLG